MSNQQDRIFKAVTDKIIAELESGTIPWRRLWAVSNPVNAVSGRAYRGINRIILALSGYSCPKWATFNQVNKLGGRVKKGEKSTVVIYWQWIKKEVERPNGEKEEIRFPYVKSYQVFNLEQTTVEIKTKKLRKVRRLKKAAAIIDNMPKRPAIGHGGDKAYYCLSTDAVQLPPKGSFEDVEGYYSTAFHELAHSTRHKTRLNRGHDVSRKFGDETYSQEELVAELAAAFMCADCNIESKKSIANSAAYIASWLKVLKADRRMVAIAASQAEKAAEFILAGKAKKKNIKKSTSQEAV